MSHLRGEGAGIFIHHLPSFIKGGSWGHSVISLAHLGIVQRSRVALYARKNLRQINLGADREKEMCSEALRVRGSGKATNSIYSPDFVAHTFLVPHVRLLYRITDSARSQRKRKRTYNRKNGESHRLLLQFVPRCSSIVFLLFHPC